MSEIRKDPITGKKTVILDDKSKNSGFRIDEPCPLCQGMSLNNLEKQVKLTFSENYKGKRAIAFPFNKPIFTIESSADTEGIDDIYDSQKGHGAEERMISLENPADPLSLELMLRIYRNRIKDLAGDKRIRYVQILKEYKKDNTEEHMHSTLIAMPNVTPVLEDELDGAYSHYKRKERCIFCDIIREESKLKRSIVSENNEFTAFVPFASKVPYEIHVLPKKHSEDFGRITDNEIFSLTGIMHPIIKKLKDLCDRNGKKFNFCLHNAPFNAQNYPTMPEYWHWHFEIMSNTDSNYLKGTGMYYNTKSPETIAEELRENKN